MPTAANASVKRSDAVLSSYRSLEDKSFRLLVVKPSSDPSSDIHVRLINAKIGSSPPYEALSYAWGCGSKVGNVVLEGQSTGVTQNLEDALRHLRLPNDERCLWVDALCINQADVQERGSQVMCMKEIYSSCTCDLLWLGDDDSIITNALSVMEHFGTVIEMGPSGREAERKQFRAIEKLFHSPMAWSRVWIMQEVASAPEVVLVAGHTILSWAEVEKFLNAEAYIKVNGLPDASHASWSHGSLYSNRLGDLTTSPQILAHQRRVTHGIDIKGGYGGSLMDVLARFRHTDSTDSRDMIYGLLGLTSNSLGILADYTKPAGEVFLDVSRRIVESARNLDLLSQGPWRIGIRSYRNTEVPSWVPDFGHPGSPRILFAPRKIFRASFNDLSVPLAINKYGELTLEGISLDDIVTIRSYNRFDMRLCFHHKSMYMAARSMPDHLLKESIASGSPGLEVYIKNDPKPTGCSGSSISSSNSSGSSNSTLPVASTFKDYWRTLLMDCQQLTYPLARLRPADVSALSAAFNIWRTAPLSKETFEHVKRELRMVARVCESWFFAVTAAGLFCMVPDEARPGDHVVVLNGSKVPLVLRPLDHAGTRFEWVGSCYVHGYMDGQVYDLKDVQKRYRSFRII